MRRPTWIVVLLWLSTSLLSLSPSPARGQLFQDIFREWRDEFRLERDEARLQYDINSGNMARAYDDLNRIGWDERNIMIDRQNIRSDLFLPYAAPMPAAPMVGPPATLIPHPQYPGYGYYPSNPSLLYPLPQPMPVPSNTPAGAVAPGGPAAGLSPTPGMTPNTSAAPVEIPVVILNSEKTGVAVHYVVDGVAYTTQSGYSQRLVVSPRSTIVFDRGGRFGETKYSLSAGVYEFRPSDTGWALYKLDPRPDSPSTGPAPLPHAPRNVMPPTGGPPALE